MEQKVKVEDECGMTKPKKGDYYDKVATMNEANESNEHNYAELLSGFSLLNELSNNALSLLLNQYACISISDGSPRSDKNPVKLSTDPNTAWAVRDEGTRLSISTGKSAYEHTFHTKPAYKMCQLLVEMAKNRGWKQVQIENELGDDVIKSSLCDRMRLFIWKICQEKGMTCRGFEPNNEDTQQLNSLDQIFKAQQAQGNTRPT